MQYRTRRWSAGRRSTWRSTRGPAPTGTPTCLTGRPHHHSANENTDGQVLDIRAEGLITQALVYSIAEKLGLDARGIYDGVKNSF